jgi:hypothetical protein
LTPYWRQKSASHYYSQFYCSIDSEVAFSPPLLSPIRVVIFVVALVAVITIAVAVAAVIVSPLPPSLCRRRRRLLTPGPPRHFIHDVVCVVIVSPVAASPSANMPS